MPKASPIQGNFNCGEVSPLLYGRVDFDRRKAALAICKNVIPTIQGGAPRRPGSRFVAPTRNYNQVSRLQGFEFSTTQAYMIEFGHDYIRFYKDNGAITEAAKTITGITRANPAVVTSAAHGYSNGDDVDVSGVVGMTQVNSRRFRVAGAAANTFQLNDLHGNAIDSSAFTAYASGGEAAKVYQIASTYTYDTLRDLKFTQSADVLYITHPLYAPRKLTRTAHTSWTLTALLGDYGPWLPLNTTATTLTPSATSGTGVTLTASAVTGINDNTGFQTTDIGRYVWFFDSGNTWRRCVITARASTTSVTITIADNFASTTASSSWRLGVWSGTTGYPSCSTFHEDRLFLAGVTSYPQRIDGSEVSNYEHFAPFSDTGTITDARAVSFTLNSSDMNAIRWLTSDEKGLLVGTVGTEWAVKPSSQSEALTPTNISAKPASAYGSENVQPVKVGKATLFMQRTGRKLREFIYFYDVDGFRAPDLTVLAEHITVGDDETVGFYQLAYQKVPQSIVWGVRKDGALVGVTYERDDDSVKAGWHRHFLGGTSDAAGSDAVTESVDVIPSSDGTSQDVWVIVQRYINGNVERYVEYLTPIFDQVILQRDAVQLDCSLTYDNPLPIYFISHANPGVVTTIDPHGLLNGDHVILSDIIGGDTALNGVTFIVANKTGTTFELTDLDGVNVDSTSFATFVGGNVRKRVSTISGLWHLEGQTVSVYADGAEQSQKTVSGGSITLATSAGTVTIGRSYNSDIQQLRLDAGAADGTAIGKTRRTHRASVMVHRTQGLTVGLDFDTMDEFQRRSVDDLMSQAPALFSGIISDVVTAPYSTEDQLCFRMSGPYPGCLLAIMPQLITQDRG